MIPLLSRKLPATAGPAVAEFPISEATARRAVACPATAPPIAVACRPTSSRPAVAPTAAATAPLILGTPLLVRQLRLGRQLLIHMERRPEY